MELPGFDGNDLIKEVESGSGESNHHWRDKTLILGWFTPPAIKVRWYYVRVASYYYVDLPTVAQELKRQGGPPAPLAFQTGSTPTDLTDTRPCGALHVHAESARARRLSAESVSGGVFPRRREVHRTNTKTGRPNQADQPLFGLRRDER